MHQALTKSNDSIVCEQVTRERSGLKGLWYGNGWVTKAVPIKERPVIGKMPHWKLGQKPRAKGYVYILECQGFLKIGSAADVASRRDDLQPGCPFPIVVMFKKRVSLIYARLAERAAHEALYDSHHGHEWFRVDLDTATATVKEAVSYAERQRRADELFATHVEWRELGWL